MAAKKTKKRRRKDAPYLPPGGTRRGGEPSLALLLALTARQARLERTAASRAELDRKCAGADMTDLEHLAVFELLPPRISAVASMATDATHVAPDRPPMPPIPEKAKAFVIDENYVRQRPKGGRPRKRVATPEICVEDISTTSPLISEPVVIRKKTERWARPPAEKPPEAIFTF